MPELSRVRQSRQMMWLPLVIVLGIFIHNFTAYIHPDEFFQSSEVIAGNYFDTVHFTPWEFSGPTPCRSVLFPLLTFFLSGSFLQGPKMAHTFHVLALFTLILLFSRIRLVLAYMKKQGNMYYIMLAPVWWTFCMRPFSNTVETVLLGCLFAVTFPNGGKNMAPSAQRIGWILALGFFNRPTFAFFAATPVLYWLYEAYLKSKASGRRWTNGIREMLGSGIYGSLFCIALDTAYFAKHNWIWRCGEKVSLSSSVLNRVIYTATGCSSTTPFSPVLTPLNWLRYNLQASNLAKHGVHSRITHAAVYMPMLFGVLAAILYACILHLLLTRDFKNTVAKFMRPPSVVTLYPRLSGPTHRDEPGHSWVESEWQLARHQGQYLLGSILVPLVALSCAPHQEARFLLPLIVPLIVAFSHHFATSRILTGISLCHFAAIWLVFGVIHQGGLIPGLVYQGARLSKLPYYGQRFEHHLIYFKTYMPPRSILGWPQKYSSFLHVHDIGGGPVSDVYALIDKLHCSAAKSTTPFHVWLMAPASVPLSQWATENSHSLRVHIEERFGPHFCGEALPGWWTVSDCLPDDDRCREDTELRGPIYSFFKYSLRLNLYKVVFLYDNLCRCAENERLFCPNDTCPSLYHRNCSSV